MRRGCALPLLVLICLAEASDSGTAACFPVPAGVVGWWPGDGDASDIVSTNDGTLQGGATASVSGVVASAFSFDGTNGYVQIPDSSAFHPTNLTIEAWVRFTSLDSLSVGGSPAGEQYIVFKQNTRNANFEGFDLGKERVGGSDYFSFILSSASGQTVEALSSTAVATGAWYHVAAVRASNFAQLYVNGQLERQTNVSFAQDYGNLPLFFGTTGQGFWDHKFKGWLDEVSLYNRALSSNEIASIYAAGAAGKCSAPYFITQPQSQSAYVASNATLFVASGGTSPLNYQWQFNGTNIASATATNLTLTNLQTTNSGSYTIVITNIVGAVTSQIAVLTVLGPQAPSITNQPGNQSVWVGSDVTFSVVAVGTPPLSYHWQKNNQNLSDGGSISGASSAALIIDNALTNDAGNYRVLVTNALGAATSQVAVLTVVTGMLGADALVLVNSSSAKYPDFQHYLQPYLDNFGIPYTVQDIATDAVGTNVGHYALIIIGHKQLDTNHVFLDSSGQSNLSAAVSNGTGLVNFDGDLSIGATPRYEFVQDIFGFTYGATTTGANASFPPTGAGSQMHYITALHGTNETFSLTNSMSMANLTLPLGTTGIVFSSSHPLVAIKRYGQGRALQWAGYEWMAVSVQGPVNGFDDVVWRGMVWAARKPFVMRGLPNHVTMRVDDVGGPFTWVHSAVDMGFKPFVALFISNVTQAGAADLRGMVTNGNATASLHSFTGGDFVYFDHANKTSWSDTVMSNHYVAANAWYSNHAMPYPKSIIAHWSEIGPNAFPGLKNMGVEFVLIEIVPGQLEYQTPLAPWLVAGPYRLFETPLLGESLYPLFYADFLAIPGHPELDGQFFNSYTEIKNMNPSTADPNSDGDWGPTTDVASSIDHGFRQLKRALDSQVLATVFTHETYISPIPDSTWRSILQGITNKLAPYKPIYVTLDYANQYMRATRTAKMGSCQTDASSGQVSVSLTGKADLPLSLYVYLGNDNSISNVVGTVPAFTNSITVTAATVGLAPVITTQPQSRTNHPDTTAQFTVGASGSGLAYQWLKNASPINQATNTSLTLSAVSTNDDALYSALVSNAYGSSLSSNARLTILPLAIQSISVKTGTAAIVWSSIPGSNYVLQRKDLISDTGWTDLLPGVQAVSNSASATNGVAGFTRRFYRVRLGP
jgi:hypothetical protein